MMKCSRGLPYPKARLRFIRYLLFAAWIHSLQAQSLINIDFGVGKESRKTGQAAAGLQSGDFWNLYRHYEPRYEAGMPIVSNGRMASLRYSDGRESHIDVKVNNAPGVWGNASGDPMMDTYLFSQDREPISIELKGMPEGIYQLFLYGFAEAGIEPEQHTSFSTLTGNQSYGPKSCNDFGEWHPEAPWIEGRQFCAFRNVRVEKGNPLMVQATASGIPVVNGLQILSRGTAPPDWRPENPEIAEDAFTELLMPRIDYRGHLEGNVWQGRAELTVTSMTTNVVSAPLFSHQVAVKSDPLPHAVFLHQDDSRSFITVLTPGQYQLGFDLTVPATRTGPWHGVQFEGPPTAINRMEFHSIPKESTLEFLTSSGWTKINPLSSNETNGQETDLTHACILDHPTKVAFKWKGDLGSQASSSFWSTTAMSQINLNPGIGQWHTTWKLTMMRGEVDEFSIRLPAGHKPINLNGNGLTDWEWIPSHDAGNIRVYFADPVSDTWALTMVSDQLIQSPDTPVHFEPPQLLGSQRENGIIRFRSNNMDMRLHSQVAGHQVNASDDGLMAFRYHERPCSIDAFVRERKPRVNVEERIALAIDETLITSRHSLSFNVDQASLHQLGFEIPVGMVVSEVVGETVKDWSVREGRLELEFNAALLGIATIDVLLEHLIDGNDAQFIMNPLRVDTADRIQTVIAVKNAPGIVSKTSSAEHLRPVVINDWEDSRNPPHLAFETKQANWTLVLDITRPTSRVVADVFQLLTIGEGKAGGSATIRFAIFNQGMREIKLQLPDHWANLEFTGPNLRDRRQEDGEWIIGLHEKVWDGYTLVISFEFSFDHSDASIPIRVPTIVGAYRQTGHIAVISHPSVELQLNAVTPSLRTVDPLDLPEFAKSLLTRPAVLAFEYSTEGAHGIDLKAGKHLTMDSLDAVVDRAEYTTVLTDSAEMLTRVTYMIKNRSRRYQRVQLPEGSTLWSCHVDGESTKVEQQEDWLMIAIPQHANQDATIAVDVVYKEANPDMGGWMPTSFELQAPQTDIPSTYAEWTLFAPASRRLSNFQGSMKAAPGVIYNLREAWRLYTDVYAGIFERGMTLLMFVLILGGGITLLVLAKRMRGWNGVINLAILSMVLLILAGMLLPALSKAKSKAQKIKTVSSLKNIGLAAKLFEADQGRFPANFSEMMDYLGSEKLLVDSVTGKQIIYAGAGKRSHHTDALLAYSPPYDGGQRVVVRANGSVHFMSRSDFQSALAADGILLAQLSTGQGTTESPPTQPDTNDPSVPTATEPPEASTTTANREDQPVNTLQTRPPTGSLRSILIDIPETGISYQFSKTLNHVEAPLVLHMNMMSGKVYRGFLRCVCALLFLGGALVTWLEWQRKRPRAWVITLATCIGLASVTGFLIMVRSLHYVLMFGTPVLLLAVVLSAIKPIYAFLSRFGLVKASSGNASAIALFLLLNGMTSTSLLHAASKDTDITIPTLPKATLLYADYEGRAVADSVTLHAKYQLYCRTPMTKLLLFKDGVAVDAFQVTKGQAQLTRDGSGIELLIEKAGETEVTMTLFIKTHSAGAYREFTPSLPNALSSELRLTLSEAEAQVESRSAASLITKNESQGLVVTAVYGPSNSPKLKWISRNPSTRNRQPSLNVASFSLLSFQDGFANLKTELQCQMIQGNQTQFPIRIPDEYNVVNVNGQGIAHWEMLSPPQEQTLMITLTTPVSDQVVLNLELTKPLNELPLELIVSVPYLKKADREVGWLGLDQVDELDLILVSLNQWRRVGKSTIPDSHLADHDSLSHAFKFSQPQGSATIRLNATSPRLNALVWNDYAVNVQGSRLVSTVKLEVQDAGLFQLRFALPENLELDLIEGPEFNNGRCWTLLKIESWR